MSQRRSQYYSEEEISDDQPHLQRVKHRPPHHRLKGCFFWFLLIIVIVLVTGTNLIYHKYRTAHSTVNTIYHGAGIQKARDTERILKKGRPVSILLMGTDTGALGRKFKGRTDTLVIAVLNPMTSTMTLVSLPRDTKIAIYGHESDFPSKLNAAYAYDGSASALRTVQKYLNVPVDCYATINMGGLENMVNAVGGVDVTPALTFSYGGYSFTKGTKVHLNGKRALAYVRMRYSDPKGDYGRQERQRQVLMSLAMHATKPQSLLNDKFLNTVSRQLTTDLKFNDLLLVAAKYRKATHHMDSTHLQGDPQMDNGQSFEVPEPTEKQRITDLLRKALELTPAQTGNTLSSNNKININ